MRELPRSAVCSPVPNRLTLEGHTDAQPFGAASAATAAGNSPAIARTHRVAGAGGLPEDRVLVQGWRRACCSTGPIAQSR
jgi:chemotaxis protein MotB